MGSRLDMRTRSLEDRLEDFLRMCEDEGRKPSLSEIGRWIGVSSSFLDLALTFASVPEDEFEDALAYVHAQGKFEMADLADEINRLTGKAEAMTSAVRTAARLRARGR